MHFRWLQKPERNLKFLWRSKSLDLMLHWAQKPSGIRHFSYHHHPFYYRSGTTDISALNEVLFRKGKKAEYHFPLEKEPGVILDIGGHIGTAAIYHTLKYPRAKVFTVEPVPENFQLLQRNIGPYPNSKAFNFGLGARNGAFSVYEDADPSNMGGYSVMADANGRPPLKLQVQTKEVGEFLQENSLEKLDLIKIDTEGAEFDILTAFPTEVLQRVSWIIGELHDHKDFDLLAYLSRWFFIGINKQKIRYRYSSFRAVNRKLAGEMSSFE